MSASHAGNGPQPALSAILAFCQCSPGLLPGLGGAVIRTRNRLTGLGRLGITMVLAAAVLAPAASAHATGGFTTQGNQIIGPSGSAFQMRGVNVLFDTSVDGLYGG